MYAIKHYYVSDSGTFGMGTKIWFFSRLPRCDWNFVSEV